MREKVSKDGMEKNEFLGSDFDDRPLKAQGLDSIQSLSFIMQRFRAGLFGGNNSVQ